MGLITGSFIRKAIGGLFSISIIRWFPTARRRPPADDRSKELFARLKELGYGIMLLSNNKEPRVKMFNDAVRVQYIFKAGKPATGNYRKAMERLGVDKEHALFVGDQLFTDIWGAKKAGIRTFLVKPIHPKEEIQIVLKRYLEKIVLFFYVRDQKRRRQ